MAAVNAPLGQLVELVGLTAALRLVDRFGGTCVYVPHANGVKAHSRLAQAIGEEAVKALAATWPKSHVMIPRGAAYLRRQRDLRVLADAREMSVAKVARKHEMTERNVYMVLQRGPEPLELGGAAGGAQADLFGAE